jgi:four helix bundle protein
MVEERAMKGSKAQVPSSKEAARSKSQGAVGFYPAVSKSVGDLLGTGEGLEMHDGPTTTDNARPPFDLEERTALFGEALVRFSKKIPRGPGNDRLVDQLVGCGTSAGANYAEASETVSRKDFKYAISRCVKEAKETRFFLRMIVAAEPQLADEARPLYREARELHLIFASMYRK